MALSMSQKWGPEINKLSKNKLYKYLKVITLNQLDLKLLKFILKWVYVHTKSNNEPFYFHPRKLSYYEKTQVDKIINEIIKDKIIQRSCSSYSSPIVLVKKKTGDSRLCIDYRKLNKITIRDNFPSPKIENKIYLLRDKHFFFC